MTTNSRSLFTCNPTDKEDLVIPPIFVPVSLKPIQSTNHSQMATWKENWYLKQDPTEPLDIFKIHIPNID